MKKIYIYGKGGHGKVVADIATSNGYDDIIFLDDNSDIKFSHKLPKYDIIIAIGDANIREKLQKNVIYSGFNLISLIDKSAVISNFAKIGKGVVIMPNAVVNADAIISDGVIINSGAIIEHDCCIGEFTHISPGVLLAGGVKIGKRSHIGIGSTVIQGIKIKDDILIGAGSVVVKDIKYGNKAFGNPCRVIES